MKEISFIEIKLIHPLQHPSDVSVLNVPGANVDESSRVGQSIPRRTRGHPSFGAGAGRRPQFPGEARILAAMRKVQHL